jgi:hypothetical protein
MVQVLAQPFVLALVSALVPGVVQLLIQVGLVQGSSKIITIINLK